MNVIQEKKKENWKEILFQVCIIGLQKSSIMPLYIILQEIQTKNILYSLYCSKVDSVDSTVNYTISVGGNLDDGIGTSEEMAEKSIVWSAKRWFT